MVRRRVCVPARACAAALLHQPRLERRAAKPGRAGVRVAGRGRRRAAAAGHDTVAGMAGADPPRSAGAGRLSIAIDGKSQEDSRPAWLFFYSSSSGSTGGAAGMVYFSSAQAPRSICLQRSEQNGRYLFSSFHSTFLEQVGQVTTVMAIYFIKSYRASAQTALRLPAASVSN